MAATAEKKNVIMKDILICIFCSLYVVNTIVIAITYFGNKRKDRRRNNERTSERFQNLYQRFEEHDERIERISDNALELRGRVEHLERQNIKQ